MQAGIIVLGGHIQALGIIRIHGREGVPGIVVDNTQKNLARHSKFCNGFYHVKDENLLEFLKELGKKNIINELFFLQTIFMLNY